jgi:hypothetical protein
LHDGIIVAFHLVLVVWHGGRGGWFGCVAGGCDG